MLPDHLPTDWQAGHHLNKYDWVRGLGCCCWPLNYGNECQLHEPALHLCIVEQGGRCQYLRRQHVDICDICKYDDKITWSPLSSKVVVADASLFRISATASLAKLEYI